MNDPAAEAEHILRGECCAHCDHYSVVSAQCWASRTTTKEPDDWCPLFERDPRRGYASSLDTLALLVNVQRAPGETDAQLRARMAQTLNPVNQAAFKRPSKP